MSGGWVSAALLVLLSVPLGGCSSAGSPADDVVTTTAGSAESLAAPTSAVTSSPVGPERVAVTGSASPERVEAYTVMAGLALDRVEDLWGEGAVRWPVRVVLPATPAEFAELTFGAAASQEAPAVTVGSLAEAHVVVHPDSWDRLTPEGRQAVLTHEVTHLAQQGHGPVPPWLGEGITEFTAHRHSDLPPATIAGSALDGVRAGQRPTTWPDPMGADTAWGGYALSWLACLYIAETGSEAALMELYEKVSAGTPLGEAFPEVLDVSEDDVLAGWGIWLGELAS